MSSVAKTNPVEAAANLLLAAMFYTRRPGALRQSFMFGRRGVPIWDRRLGVELSYDPSLLRKAALFVRRNGAPHLRSLAVGDLTSQLMNFVSENFCVIAEETFGHRFDSSFADYLSSDAKAAFADAMAASDIFMTPELLALFPLIVVRVDTAFDSEPFFLIPPDGLTGARLPEGYPLSQVRSELFPPIRDWQGQYKMPASWLGVRTASSESARQMRAAVLGAIALLPHHLERFLFTGRTLFGGQCTLSDRWHFSTGDPHTPALSEDVVIGQDDHAWLGLLVTKLRSSAIEDKRQIKALEYFYRAWMPDPVKRFPTLFATLDAIYGDAGQATQAIINAVGPVMGADYDYERLKLLLGLRASVIHGGAPNVYESNSYHKYYERYDVDATADLELIVARCLQTAIFNGTLVERPHTHAVLIKQNTDIEV